MNEKEGLMALEQQMIQQNLMNLRNQLLTLSSQTEELMRLKEDLVSIKDIKDKKTLVPLGAGIFLESELKKPKDVVMNVGSNILVKKDFDSSIKILDKQIEELKNIQSQLEREISKIEFRALNSN